MNISLLYVLSLQNKFPFYLLKLNFIKIFPLYKKENCNKVEQKYFLWKIISCEGAYIRYWQPSVIPDNDKYIGEQISVRNSDHPVPDIRYRTKFLNLFSETFYSVQRLKVIIIKIKSKITFFKKVIAPQIPQYMS
jgi:hypothetical protein